MNDASKITIMEEAAGILGRLSPMLVDIGFSNMASECEKNRSTLQTIVDDYDEKEDIQEDDPMAAEVTCAESIDNIAEGICKALNMGITPEDVASILRGMADDIVSNKAEEKEEDNIIRPDFT